jgi:hypothetical protein
MMSTLTQFILSDDAKHKVHALGIIYKRFAVSARGSEYRRVVAAQVPSALRHVFRTDFMAASEAGGEYACEQ